MGKLFISSKSTAFFEYSVPPVWVAYFRDGRGLELLLRFYLSFHAGFHGFELFLCHAALIELLFGGRDLRFRRGDLALCRPDRGLCLQFLGAEFLQLERFPPLVHRLAPEFFSFLAHCPVIGDLLLGCPVERAVTALPVPVCFPAVPDFTREFPPLRPRRLVNHPAAFIVRAARVGRYRLRILSQRFRAGVVLPRPSTCATFRHY